MSERPSCMVCDYEGHAVSDSGGLVCPRCLEREAKPTAVLSVREFSDRLSEYRDPLALLFSHEALRAEVERLKNELSVACERAAELAGSWMAR